MQNYLGKREPNSETSRRCENLAFDCCAVSLEFEESLFAMKPTIPQVEQALGVKAEDWDCVDPEELVDTIYRLSTEAGNAPADKSNVHALQDSKLKGKGHT